MMCSIGFQRARPGGVVVTSVRVHDCVSVEELVWAGRGLTSHGDELSASGVWQTTSERGGRAPDVLDCRAQSDAMC